jgi:hypothetical protein
MAVRAKRKIGVAALTAYVGKQFLGAKKRLYKRLCWLIGPLVGPSVRPSVHLSVCPHNEILRNLLTWKTGYIVIASRRGEGRGNQLMSKTGYVEIASRLVMDARSCF